MRHGSFSAVRQLVRDIEDYIVERNLNPKRYTWNAKGEDIPRNIESARKAPAQAQAKQQ